MTGQPTKDDRYWLDQTPQNVCPECRHPVDAAREIEVYLHPAFCPDWKRPPLPPRPVEDICPTCGKPKTIRMTEAFPPAELVLTEPDERYRDVPLLSDEP